MQLRLTVGFSPNPRIRPLVDRTVTPQNIDLDFVCMHAAELFNRNLRFEEFDVMEMSIACALIAKERSEGAKWDWSALPVFLTKTFLWANLCVNAASGIGQIGDLRGKRVGVPDYCMDAVLWMSLLLKDFHNIEPKELTWYIGRSKELSHGVSLGLDRDPPSGVDLKWVGGGDTLEVMLEQGLIDVAMLLPSARPDSAAMDTFGYTRLNANPGIRKLIEDGGREILTRYYLKNKFVPPNHMVIVKNKVLRQHPWVAMELYKAFQRSKGVAYERARELEPTYRLFESNDLKEQAAIFGKDPFPLGIRANRQMLEAAFRGVLLQGLVKKRFQVEDLFYHSTLDT